VPGKLLLYSGESPHVVDLTYILIQLKQHNLPTHPSQSSRIGGIDSDLSDSEVYGFSREVQGHFTMAVCVSL
jgi:hypothetical protein